MARLNSTKRTFALLLLTVAQGTLTGVAQYSDQFPPAWRPFLLLAGIVGTTLSGALVAFVPQLRRRPRPRDAKLLPSRGKF
jgi:hypothetical protein